MGKRLTHDIYVQKLADKNSNIEICEEYLGTHTKILHKCKECNNIWYDTPDNVLHKKNCCPVCSGKKIGPPPIYKNSIWDSEYKEYFSQYLTEEQMKNNSHGSKRKIDIVCPNCHNVKQITPLNLLYQGIDCICSDGQSYPNKFVFSLISQCGIQSKLEYSPKWANKKRYDIFIPSLNCIIENQGKQHYEEGFSSCGGKTLKEEESNDFEKKELALKNGIKYYIQLDCRESNKTWIKNAIINSQLLRILNIDEAKIDWNKCDEYATTSLVKEVCRSYNENPVSISVLAKKFNIGISTISRYLKKGDVLGLCDYNPKSNPTPRPVSKFNKDGTWIEDFSSITEAKKTHNISEHRIISCCKNKKGYKTAGGYIWKYKEI